jgi:hypothetical protein
VWGLLDSDAVSGIAILEQIEGFPGLLYDAIGTAQPTSRRALGARLCQWAITRLQLLVGASRAAVTSGAMTLKRWKWQSFLPNSARVPLPLSSAGASRSTCT